MFLLGYVAALLIGMVLGLLGGGGSILTVPTLVYLVGIEPLRATAYSLFVVGVTALAGTIGYLRQRLVAFPTALLFASSSLGAVFATRRWLLPALPAEIGHIGAFVLTKDALVMITFAILMVLAATAMIRGRQSTTENPATPTSPSAWPPLLGIGAGVGVLTGFVGAGGGFLIIPALVMLARLPMKQAVGTSLLIIAINSLIGFTGDLGGGLAPDWSFLLGFTSVALAGIGIGTMLAQRISGARLKPAFGWLTLLMGTSVLLRSLLGK